VDFHGDVPPSRERNGRRFPKDNLRTDSLYHVFNHPSRRKTLLGQAATEPPPSGRSGKWRRLLNFRINLEEGIDKMS
jgi:hypothetical protein